MRTRRFSWATYLTLGLALMAGCADDEAAVDGRDGGASPRDRGVSGPPDALVIVRPDASLLGSFGEPCRTGAECASTYCIEAPTGGKICTERCNSDCPEGFECTPVDSSDGVDRDFYCLADRPDLCRTCEVDRDCDDNEDLCLQIGLSTWCGEDCSRTGLCPDGYECVDVIGRRIADEIEDLDAGVGDAGLAFRQCVPVERACAPCTDADGDGYGDGDDCLGFDCDDNNPLIYAGAPELCDGLDNNCNSIPDDVADLVDPPEEMTCLDEGVCLGSAVICLDGAWACNYPEVYEAEGELSCDGLDNDCDGAADDEFDVQSDPAHCGFCNNACAYPNAEGVCDGGLCRLGPCDEGFYNIDQINENGCEYVCALTRDGVEACDVVDNDCDGEVDEDFDLSSDVDHCGACNQPCAPVRAEGICVEGVCAVDTCEAGWVDLDGEVANGCEFECSPSNGGVEICDGVDNDCDGSTDEDFDLDTSLDHCGGCGQVCAFAHGDPICEAGACRLEACQPGWFNANGTLEDGCEYSCVLTNDSVEACDGVDNDCDAVTDEGFDLSSDVLNCGQCRQQCFFANAAPVCLAGSCALAACNEGHYDIDGRPDNGCEYACVPSNGGVEICDNTDNDCDGQIDEDFDLLSDVDNCNRCGNTCALANAFNRCVSGSCRIAQCQDNFYDIDGLLENGCEYSCALTNGGLEVCDSIDNDCDGATDEDFDFDTSLDHCGGCGQVCARDGGEAACRGGTCRLSRCLEGYEDRDGLEENGCEFECQAEDWPDAEGLDANCDGIDGDISDAVFVSATEGSPDGDGSMANPLDTISAGISRAQSLGRRQVLIGAGQYSGIVIVRSGISLYGGYDPIQGWRRNFGAFITRTQAQPFAMIIANIQAQTEIQGLHIVGLDAPGAGQTAYGIYLRDSADGLLTLSHNVISAGRGGDGQSGQDAAFQSSGDLNGGKGNNGKAGGDGTSSGGEGGGGGVSACGRTGGLGGRGGYSNGASGVGEPGVGGTAGGVAQGAGCDNPGDAGRDGSDGANGANGASGNGGGLVSNDLWVGNHGAAGLRGGHGNGGGGGSGGAGVSSCHRCGLEPCDLDFVGCVCNADRGGGGGGGGAGGCGGNQATGGTAGGGSFGIFMVRSAPLLVENEISSGRGGDGGRGGRGNKGGDGGGNGLPGTGRDDSSDGGRGGEGGDGGCGGHGGGGSGGVSFPLYTRDSDPDLSGNLFIPGQGGQGGAAGCDDLNGRFCCERPGNAGGRGQSAPRGGD